MMDSELRDRHDPQRPIYEAEKTDDPANNGFKNGNGEGAASCVLFGPALECGIDSFGDAR